MAPSLHATAVLVGAKALLIRGAPGSGKTSLALRLVALGEAGASIFVRLVADDRVHLAASGGRLVVSAPAAIAGLAEQRGIGLRPIPFESAAVIGLVVDLGAADAARMPEEAALTASIAGVSLARLPVAAGVDPLPIVASAISWCRIPAAVLAAPHAGAYR
ncbi:HPr kinase/phosphatase C-terminal domain-containing protein [Phreatobacter sp.]|uniref:HPr kinase/phosphorylase n=1 Tax=Phreatobacter sp. TaxID=1966341 RepID=UPI0022C3FC3C|nr:HPr kinase/phosphatase C-terminal domain-containing protein [Phreatobacter sp.]MCZ8316774.1 HPr kinase/phosphatase C-terminal domain-containing protein [Phreatobacter sp.]